MSCSGASSRKVVFPLSIDKFEERSGRSSRKDFPLEKEFYKSHKGIFDNRRLRLHTVQCRDGEISKQYIYKMKEEWCIYYSYMPSKCFSSDVLAMEAVCEKE
jgi:hypothetical protein